MSVRISSAASTTLRIRHAMACPFGQPFHTRLTGSVSAIHTDRPITRPGPLSPAEAAAANRMRILLPHLRGERRLLLLPSLNKLIYREPNAVDVDKSQHSPLLLRQLQPPCIHWEEPVAASSFSVSLVVDSSLNSYLPCFVSFPLEPLFSRDCGVISKIRL